MLRPAYHIIAVMLTILSVGSLRTAWGAEALASAPAVIHYQAHLMDKAGLNYEGDASIEVRLYDSPVLGAGGDLGSEYLIYAEKHERIHVQRGVLRFTIGEGVAIGNFAGKALPLEPLAMANDVYVELRLNGETIEPRQRAGFLANALRAQYAVKAEELAGNINFGSADLPNMPASKVSGVLAPDRLPEKISSSYISGAVPPDRIPSGIPLSSLTNGTLNNSYVPDLSSFNVKDGVFADERIDSLLVRKAKFGVVSSGSGNIADGQQLSIPAGFSPRQCGWIVTPTATLKLIDGYLMGINYGVNTFNVYTTYGNNNTPPVAHCELRNGDYQGDNYYPCSMNYLVICKK